MLLTCDIGNSKIKTGLFDDNDLIKLKTFDNINSLIDYIGDLKIKNVALSSVVPPKTKELAESANKNFGIFPFIISKDVNFNLKINYDSLETLGIDRICSAEGAFYLYKNSEDYKNYNNKTFIVSIDFGTATTINFVKFPGEFTGGLIVPGLQIMFDSLHKAAAQLPQAELSDYKNFIGTDTRSSIASGVINSTVGLIEKSFNYLNREFNIETIRAFITGGNAEKILPYFKFDYRFEKALVLLGIKGIYERNKKINN